MQKKNKGFTLAELLIVVAIIGVLIAVAVPMFGAQRERANIAVDQATMRNAYAQFVAGHLLGDIQANTLYYYDAASQSFTSDKPAGYGKSKTNSENWWTGAGETFGIPKSNGTPSALRLEMDDAGNVTFRWGGGAYTGLNVMDANEYEKLYTDDSPGATFEETQHTGVGTLNNCKFNTALVEKDKILLDSLQEEFQSLTYGQIKSMIYDENGKLKLQGQTGKNNHLCVVIAKSEINKTTYTADSAKNVIYLPEVFAKAGYDTSADNKYIVTSIPGTDQARIWVNLRIKESDLKNLKETDSLWNTPAKNAYTYVKAKQWGDTANVLRDDIRVTPAK